MKILKISLAVIFSIILWGFVSLSRDYFSTFEIPLEVTNVAKGYAVGFISNSKVSITVKGKGWMLAPFSFGQKNKYIVSVAGKKGVIKKDIRNDLEKNIWIPSNIQVVQISPESIDLQIEKVINKSVRIVPDISFKFNNSFGLTSDIEIKPHKIIISGPKSIVKKIDTIRTKFIEFNNLDKNYFGSIELKKIHNISFEHSFINIKFDVQKIVENTYKDIPVVIKRIPPKQELVLVPNKVDVILRGGIKLLSKLTSNDIDVWVDFSQAIKDTLGTLKPNIKIPEGFKFLSCSPERLSYTIKQY